ncbi:glycosyltransferase [Chitinophaga nivalis]|uniref:Glycosyltransferase family 2 protein n=1 Tax=Chitinophaga nivalis TaxID=2991709 RepID=A0ABT3IM21_9BACT|nr:glycosyltransferase [Chitinophaga nivalis]MCW3465314.1 glycosyltransferase family 2 protein [Chitinophaga nivalis]MCW3484994.1 glycosyltransferase family 2 protein [Chitinophaga nivalis]
MTGPFSLLAWTTIVLLLLKGVTCLFTRLPGKKKKSVANVPDHADTMEDLPALTILIPAYNEEVTIAAVIETLLCHELPGLRILVINDGSTDNTLQVLVRRFGLHPDVSIYTQSNKGKSAALNYGLELVQTAIVGVIDADTMVPPGVLPSSLSHFSDPDIAAVCGNIKVGNANKNWLIQFQKIEYQTINYEKSFLQHRNWISVIPGALGLFRTNRLREAGGFRETALTEDYDLTIRLVKQGYKITYASAATGETEVPETLPALYKQRMRWIYGNLQTILEHRRFLRSRSYNASSRMALLFDLYYNKLAQVTGCVIDGWVLWSVVQGSTAWLLYYVVFILADGICSWMGLYHNRAETGAYLRVIPQRFFFRIFTTIIILHAAMVLLFKGKQQWNKLTRTGKFRLQEMDTA